jgi:hypothetical protein
MRKCFSLRRTVSVALQEVQFVAAAAGFQHQG